MTCKEKLQKEHPEAVDDAYFGGCAGCPHNYGYLERPKHCFFSASEEKCTDCWNREIPEVRVNTAELLYSNLRSLFDGLSDSILGKEYYNFGMDVYTADEHTRNDILKAYKKLQEERDKCRRAFDFAVLAMLILAFIVFFFVL